MSDTVSIITTAVVDVTDGEIGNYVFLASPRFSTSNRISISSTDQLADRHPRYGNINHYDKHSMHSMRLNNGRPGDRDGHETLKPETETRRWCVSRPSRDRDVETETASLPVEVVTMAQYRSSGQNRTTFIR